MQISFDSEISKSEAQGIILLLQSLYPALGAPISQPVNSLALQPSDRTPAEQTNLVQATTSGPTLVPSDSEAPRRTRRTKAEIEADEAAAKQVATQAVTQAAEPGPVSVGPTLQTAIDATTEAPPAAKPITKEELTALANGFIQRHSMEDAFALLQSYGCGRINEVLALPTDKLNELAEKLRG
jgi:hypothetical protein